MRVALLHNKSAGSENHAARDIEASVRRGGHEIVDLVSDLDALLATLGKRRCDLIVIAGGDGTVSRAACALAGRHVPLAILPLGTANNTALSLGVKGDVDDLVSGWARGSYREVDLGTIQAGERLSPFSEAVGWGVFPDVIATAAEMSSPDQREHTLERDRRVFQAVIERAKPRKYELSVDGATFSGDFLFVEVVNVPFIGPQLHASPESDPSDGRFEIVVAGESERTTLFELAGGGRIGSDVRLPTRSARHVIVRGAPQCLHRDGSLVEADAESTEWSVTVEPKSVTYLLGPEG